MKYDVSTDETVELITGKEDAKIDIPVLLIFFNRPQKIAAVFEQVKKARPARLYLYQDGARENREDDIESVKACRAAVSDIDWNCEVHRLYQSRNYGCDPSEFIAQKWMFSYEEMGIILEDDDVPAQALFPFFRELLIKYKDDNRVAIICGMNNYDIEKEVKESYFFSKRGSIWGWASWRRFIDLWDGEYSWIDDEDKIRRINEYCDHGLNFDAYYKGACRHRESGREHYESIMFAAAALNNMLNIVPKYDVPLPADGKWLPAGEIMGDGYSLAWRVLDAAQGWGVAQRRKRVFVVLDLAGGRAGEVLFESEGLSGYTPPGGEARKGAAGGAARCAGAAGFCYESGEASRGIGYQEEESPTLRCWKPPGVAVREPPLTLKIRSGCDGGGKGALIQHDLSATLGCHNDQTLFAPKAFGIGSAASKGMLSPNPKSGFYEAATSRTLDQSGGNACCNQGGMVVVEPKVPAYYVTACSYMQIDREVASPIMARDWKDPPVIGHESPSYCFDRACFTSGENTQYRLSVREEVAATLIAEGPGAISASPEDYLVRRLTPLECCRLQGFPDGWTEHLGTEEPGEREIARWVGVFEDWYRAQGKAARASPGRVAKWLKDPHSDAAQYKAYGNSVAVPCVFFVLAGIAWAENRGDET